MILHPEWYNVRKLWIAISITITIGIALTVADNGFPSVNESAILVDMSRLEIIFVGKVSIFFPFDVILLDRLEIFLSVRVLIQWMVRSGGSTRSTAIAIAIAIAIHNSTFSIFIRN
jgi:hypothetical protein